MDYGRNDTRRGFENRNQNQIPQSNRYSQQSDNRESRENRENRGGLEWESSFSQILTRTKQNINRVNEKYGTSSSFTTRPGYNDFNHSSQPENNLHDSLRSSSDGGRGSLVLLNEDPRNYQMLSPGKNRENNRDNTESDYNPKRNNEDDNPVVEELIRRINGLESKLQSQSQSNGNNGNNESEERKDNIDRKSKKIDLADLESKINFLLSDFSDLSEQVSGTVINVRDIQRQNVQNSAQVASVSGLVAETQRDVDSRRGLLAKMDNWARLGEVWREEVDEKVAAVGRQVKVVERSQREVSDSLIETISRNDFSLFKDRFTASESWKEKMVRDFEALEGQILTLEGRQKQGNLQDTLQGSLHSSISQGNLQSNLLRNMLGVDSFNPAALPPPLPMAAAGHGQQTSHTAYEQQTGYEVSEKVTAELKDEVRQCVTDSFQEFERKMKSDLESMVQGLLSKKEVEREGKEVEGSEEERVQSEMNRTIDGNRSKSDSMSLHIVTSNLQQLSDTVMSLKEDVERLESGSRVQLQGFERMVEECLEQSAASVLAVQSRCAGLEGLVRDGELAQRTALSDLRDDLADRVRGQVEDLSDSFLAHERRMLVIERISDDVLGRLKMGGGAVDAYFQASEDVKQFKKNSESVKALELSLTNMEKSNSEMSSGCDAIRADVVSVQSATTSLQSAVSNLLNGKQSNTEDVEEKQKKFFTDFQSTLSTLRDENESDNAILNKNNENTKKDIEKLKASAEKIGNDFSVFQAIFSDFSHDSENIRGKINEMSKNLLTLNMDKELHVIEKDANLNKLLSVEGCFMDCKDEISTLKNENKVRKELLSEKINTIESEIIKLQTHHDEIKSQQLQLKSEAIENNNIISQQNKALSESNEKNAIQNNQIELDNEKKSIHEEYERKDKLIKEEINKIKEVLEKKEKEQEKKEKDLRNKGKEQEEKDTQELALKLTSLQHDSLQMQTDLRDLGLKFVRLDPIEAKITNLAAQIKDIKSQVEDLQSESTAAISDKTLKTENKGLQSENKAEIKAYQDTLKSENKVLQDTQKADMKVFQDRVESAQSSLTARIAALEKELKAIMSEGANRGSVNSNDNYNAPSSSGTNNNYNNEKPPTPPSIPKENTKNIPQDAKNIPQAAKNIPKESTVYIAAEVEPVKAINNKYAAAASKKVEKEEVAKRGGGKLSFFNNEESFRETDSDEEEEGEEGTVNVINDTGKILDKTPTVSTYVPSLNLNKKEVEKEVEMKVEKPSYASMAGKKEVVMEVAKEGVKEVEQDEGVQEFIDDSDDETTPEKAKKQGGQGQGGVSPSEPALGVADKLKKIMSRFDSDDSDDDSDDDSAEDGGRKGINNKNDKGKDNKERERMDDYRNTYDNEEEEEALVSSFSAPPDSPQSLPSSLTPLHIPSIPPITTHPAHSTDPAPPAYQTHTGSGSPTDRRSSTGSALTASPPRPFGSSYVPHTQGVSIPGAVPSPSKSHQSAIVIPYKSPTSKSVPHIPFIPSIPSRSGSFSTSPSISSAHLSPRQSAVNSLIAKFSSPPTSTGSRSTSFTSESIGNVHSDINPNPTKRKGSISSVPGGLCVSDHSYPFLQENDENERDNDDIDYEEKYGKDALTERSERDEKKYEGKALFNDKEGVQIKAQTAVNSSIQNNATEPHNTASTYDNNDGSKINPPPAVKAVSDIKKFYEEEFEGSSSEDEGNEEGEKDDVDKVNKTGNMSGNTGNKLNDNTNDKTNIITDKKVDNSHSNKYVNKSDSNDNNDSSPVTDFNDTSLNDDVSYFDYSHFQANDYTNLNKKNQKNRKSELEHIKDIENEKIKSENISEKEEEDKLRLRINSENDDDDSAFIESNPMKRRSLQKENAPRVFINPSKKIVLSKSSVIGSKKNITKNMIDLSNRSVSRDTNEYTDSIPDITESNRDSPLTVIDDYSPSHSPYSQSPPKLALNNSGKETKGIYGNTLNSVSSNLVDIFPTNESDNRRLSYSNIYEDSSKMKTMDNNDMKNSPKKIEKTENRVKLEYNKPSLNQILKTDTIPSEYLTENIPSYPNIQNNNRSSMDRGSVENLKDMDNTGGANNINNVKPNINNIKPNMSENEGIKPISADTEGVQDIKSLPSFVMTDFSSDEDSSEDNKDGQGGGGGKGEKGEVGKGGDEKEVRPKIGLSGTTSHNSSTGDLRVVINDYTAPHPNNPNPTGSNRSTVSNHSNHSGVSNPGKQSVSLGYNKSYSNSAEMEKRQEVIMTEKISPHGSIGSHSTHSNTHSNNTSNINSTLNSQKNNSNNDNTTNNSNSANKTKINSALKATYSGDIMSPQSEGVSTYVSLFGSVDVEDPKSHGQGGDEGVNSEYSMNADKSKGLLLNNINTSLSNSPMSLKNPNQNNENRNDNKNDRNEGKYSDNMSVSTIMNSPKASTEEHSDVASLNTAVEVDEKKLTIRERLKLKQDLIKKQREEKSVSTPTNPASSRPVSLAISSMPLNVPLNVPLKDISSTSQMSQVAPIPQMSRAPGFALEPPQFSQYPQSSHPADTPQSSIFSNPSQVSSFPSHPSQYSDSNSLTTPVTSRPTSMVLSPGRAMSEMSTTPINSRPVSMQVSDSRFLTEAEREEDEEEYHRFQPMSNRDINSQYQSPDMKDKRRDIPSSNDKLKNMERDRDVYRDGSMAERNRAMREVEEYDEDDEEDYNSSNNSTTYRKGDYRNNRMNDNNDNRGNTTDNRDSRDNRNNNNNNSNNNNNNNNSNNDRKVPNRSLEFNNSQYNIDTVESMTLNPTPLDTREKDQDSEEKKSSFFKRMKKGFMKTVGGTKKNPGALGSGSGDPSSSGTPQMRSPLSSTKGSVQGSVQTHRQSIDSEDNFDRYARGDDSRGDLREQSRGQFNSSFSDGRRSENNSNSNYNNNL